MAYNDRPPRRYVPGVTIYGDFCSRSLPIADALAFTQTHDVSLILGRQRGGYLGREMVTEDDLARWVHEDEAAAEWRAIEDGEARCAEMGLLR